MSARFLAQHAARLRFPTLVGVAAIGCYYGLWNAYFTGDDFWMLGWVRQQPTLSGAVWAEFGYSVRMLLDALLWIRVELFDLNPTPYYWVSLAQHILVALLVYWLARFWTQRSGTAFIAALLFATTSTHFEVVTWITGSNYSLAAMAYLAALICFALYRQLRRRLWYAGSLGMYCAGLLLTELAISLPLVLVAYSLTLGRDPRARLMGWRQLRSVAPFWVLLGVYLVVQLQFMHGGHSEAAKAEQIYTPGLHMLGNLSYLLYLALPPYGPAIISGLLGAGSFNAAVLILALAGHGLALFLLLRGSPVVRFAVLFMYLTFLPYTLWQGDFAAAIRYRYLPAIGLSLLIALLLTRFNDRLLQIRRVGYGLIVPGVVLVLVAMNIFLVQTWVRRHLENSSFRRVVVSDLIRSYASAAPGTKLYIEVPADKYVDIEQACQLVFRQPIQCYAFTGGSSGSFDPGTRPDDVRTATWLQATDGGLRQVYPIVGRTR